MYISQHFPDYGSVWRIQDLHACEVREHISKNEVYNVVYTYTGHNLINNCSICQNFNW